jgi:hypothetical protein
MLPSVRNVVEVGAGVSRGVDPNVAAGRGIAVGELLGGALAVGVVVGEDGERLDPGQDREGGEVAGAQRRPDGGEDAGGREGSLDPFGDGETEGHRVVRPEAHHAARLAVAAQIEARFLDWRLAAAVRGEPGPMQADRLGGKRVGDQADQAGAGVAGRVPLAGAPSEIAIIRRQGAAATIEIAAGDGARLDRLAGRPQGPSPGGEGVVPFGLSRLALARRTPPGRVIRRPALTPPRHPHLWQSQVADSSRSMRTARAIIFSCAVALRA